MFTQAQLLIFLSLSHMANFTTFQCWHWIAISAFYVKVKTRTCNNKMTPPSH